jgi:hypothetical protein
MGGNHWWMPPNLASTTTIVGGYFAIQISSQTTKKDVFEIPLLWTIIPHKLLSFCDTITFTPVQSQVLRNSRTWYNRKTFSITIASIHCLRLTLHRKLFAANHHHNNLANRLKSLSVSDIRSNANILGFSKCR